jgi:hypothetical protein
MSERTPCPAWCTTRHRHLGHEGATLLGRASVTLYQLGDKPVELRVWDQSGTPYRSVQLDAADALTLARVLSALDPSDLIRFAAALADGASVLGGDQ